MIEESELLNTEIYDEILRPRVLKAERISRKTMIQLVKSGHAAFLFLHDFIFSSLINFTVFKLSA
jgi:hypothetical protein